jgi:hypothetical protein
MHRSEQINELVGALAKAQLSFTAVLKDAENPAYTRGTRKSMYATLDSVISATRKPLAENGLCIIALPEEMVEDTRLKITSMLVHTSGQFIESTLTMTAVDRVTPQELGKLITYARRYQWTSLTGTAPEDDTDGNESSGVGSKEAAQTVAKSKVRESAQKRSDDAVALTEWKEGLLAVSGGGLAILRVEIEPEVLKEMGFKLDGNVVTIPAAKSFAFEDLCKRAKVECYRAKSAKGSADPSGSTS